MRLLLSTMEPSHRSLEAESRMRCTLRPVLPKRWSCAYGTYLEVLGCTLSFMAVAVLDHSD